MALARPISRMKPVNTEAMAPGTSSDPVCSGSSGSARASARAAMVPPAPSSSDGTKPMNGSTSRSMFAAASPAARDRESISLCPPPWPARPTPLASRLRAPSAAASGPAPRPVADTVRMSDGNRLLPSASRFNPIARPMSRFKVPLLMPRRLSMPPAARTGTAEMPS